MHIVGNGFLFVKIWASFEKKSVRARVEATNLNSNNQESNCTCVIGTFLSLDWITLNLD